MEYLNDVEYEPDENGIAEKIKCPLVDDWISPIDCMENQDVNERFIPEQFKRKNDWKNICQRCPFREY